MILKKVDFEKSRFSQTRASKTTLHLRFLTSRDLRGSPESLLRKSTILEQIQNGKHVFEKNIMFQRKSIDMIPTCTFSDLQGPQGIDRIALCESRFFKTSKMLAIFGSKHLRGGKSRSRSLITESCSIHLPDVGIRLRQYRRQAISEFAHDKLTSRNLPAMGQAN